LAQAFFSEDEVEEMKAAKSMSYGGLVEASAQDRSRKGHYDEEDIREDVRARPKVGWERGDFQVR
jgi:hypothetical protein